MYGRAAAVHNPPAGPAASRKPMAVAHGGRRHAEREPIRLTDNEARDLVQFLGALSSR